MQRSGGNNGNIYDLRKDLQRPQAPSQKKETSGSTDSRYGFNGEPLSFAPGPDVQRRRPADPDGQQHRVSHPAAPHSPEQCPAHPQSGPEPQRTAFPPCVCGPEQLRHGTQAPAAAGLKISRPGRRQTEPPASATKISACARRSNSRSGIRCGGKNARNAA